MKTCERCMHKHNHASATYCRICKYVFTKKAIGEHAEPRRERE